jgi:hypothetical protein
LFGSVAPYFFPKTEGCSGYAPFIFIHFFVSPNGSRLCEVADFQHKCSIEKLNLNLALNCHRSTAPAILQIGRMKICFTVVIRGKSKGVIPV